ncbi:MAG: hypothetical protein ABI488_18960 [Polyangiaceae bacterium]
MGGLGLVACGDCHDNDEAANAFLAAPENRACHSNDECVVVSTGCAYIERSFCGQAMLSAEAAKSSRWHELQGQISDCNDSSCGSCDAALIPMCIDAEFKPGGPFNGLCGRQ